MNIMKRRQRTIEDLKDKEYRDAFAIEHIDTGIPFQIRALRKQKDRKWTQKELAKRARMAQETISRIENPNYGKLTLKTLKRLASVFDVALMVRFVPFSELVGWELSLTPASLEAVDFDKDFQSDVTSEDVGVAVSEEAKITADQEQTIVAAETSSTGNVASLKDYRSKKYAQSFVPQKVAVNIANHN
jgi:transcriptional regulator with XRE-family HTH domain